MSENEKLKTKAESNKLTFQDINNVLNKHNEFIREGMSLFGSDKEKAKQKFRFAVAELEKIQTL